jgi:hypothetical protein
MPSQQQKSQKQTKSSSGAIRERRTSAAVEAMAIYERKPRTPRPSRPNSPVLHRPESESAAGSERGSVAGSPDSDAADLPELATLGAMSAMAALTNPNVVPGQWAPPAQPDEWEQAPPPAEWQTKSQNVAWGKRAGDPGSVEPIDIVMDSQRGKQTQETNPAAPTAPALVEVVAPVGLDRALTPTGQRAVPDADTQKTPRAKGKGKAKEPRATKEAKVAEAAKRAERREQAIERRQAFLATFSPTIQQTEKVAVVVHEDGPLRNCPGAMYFNEFCKDRAYQGAMADAYENSHDLIYVTVRAAALRNGQG